MKLIWKTVLPFFTDTDALKCTGALIKENQCLKYYFFRTFSTKLSSMTFDILNGEVIECDENINKNLENEELYGKRKPPKHYSEDDFVFDEYRIAHMGEWGYICTKNNEVLWKKSLRGYLYTDIIKVGDRIVFGTDGYGGHFYSLDINSGEIIFDFNTKGTSSFLQANNSFYFSLNKRKSSEVYRIDYDGNILDSIELEGVRNDYSYPLALCDQSIYAVTLIKKVKGTYEEFTPVVNRIDL